MNGSLPTVTIVIPVYNEAADMRACLMAIARQTVLPDEVIVVDNNCNDGSMAIAREFPFVKIVAEPRQGIVYARNAGFDAAGSDIIGRIDADSRLKPGWVETVKRYYHPPAHHRRGVSGRGYYYNLKWPGFAGMIQHDIAFGYNRLILGDNILWGSNMAVPRALWQEVGPATCTRTDIHEDIDLAIHLLKAGYGVDYRKSMLAGVRMRRVHSDRSNLWPNLMLWPRTFRSHHYPRWWLALVGAVLLYLLVLPFRTIEYLTMKSINRPRPRRRKR